jgi:hypothetical protein
MNANEGTVQKKISAAILALLLALVSVTLAAPMASAVGANQNDLGSAMDLPDNSTSINSSQAVMNMNGFAPMASGSMYGELDVGDDEDWFAMTLNANEGVTLQIAYNTSYTSSNGSTYFNDFELWAYDSSMNTIEFSINNNPEVVSTNASTGPHGGTVYFQIVRYAGYGSYTLDFWMFSTSSTGGGGSGGNGTAPPSNCVGNGTLNSDILEPNDSTSTATQASALPLSCTGLSIDSGSDVDYFEVMMLSGVTYYVNVSFISTNGDIDLGWESSTGTYLTGSGGTGSLESMSYTSLTNQTSYIQVYGYSGATNVYAIEISTDLPGGGQSFETVSVAMNNLTSSVAYVDGITSGVNYTLTSSTSQYFLNGTFSQGTSSTSPFTANGTTYNSTLSTLAPIMIESDYCLDVGLSDASGSLSADSECIRIEMLESTVLSSTTGSHSATNLTINTDYVLWWFVINNVDFQNNISVSNDIDMALNASMVDQDTVNFTSTSTTESWQINWSGITTMDEHYLVAVLYTPNSVVNFTSSEGFIGIHDDNFIPQLPSMLIDTYSTSSTAATNNVDVKGADLVTGDSYQYLVRVVDAAGASIDSSGLTSFTATAQNMSMPTFTYSTPNMSGVYCAEVLLYSSTSVQLVGDSDCFSLTIDDDNDGVANEDDLCPNSTTTQVDQDGCELSQKDTDNDGYNDDVDAFPTDASQHSDMDGDGFGDNPNGNSPDTFPADSSQWSDIDADGYGDNPTGNNSDAFPYDPSQWTDADGDGYGDNATGSYPDAYPTDASQWVDADGDGYGDNPTGTNGDQFPNDASQWADADGDGYGDNAAGTDPDAFPADSTQWTDGDGDGYGDNAGGNAADAFPNDASQWSDQDGDGFGDNQAGTAPDAFPMDGTQWLDTDGDGYGDNPAGNAADAFPTDSTQWADGDNDGFGDNAMGNDGDQCLNTPAGQSVDENGCASSQKDDDLDGVNNAQDACPQTPAGETVDASGCSGSQEDADNDGVMDAFDLCPSTPLGSSIDATGCADSQLDTDEDGITNDLDQCPTSTRDVPVNGEGCAADERDSDMDGVMDADDFCQLTPTTEEADDTGCSNSQRDDDNDSYTNNVDLCPNTSLEATPDSQGCSDDQYDDDNDLIDNTVDECSATPAGEQVNSVGCSTTQTDQDMDGIKDAYDLCRDTAAGQGTDLDGCSEYQKDDDNDGVVNVADRCKGTEENQTVINDEGCAINQLDTDGDGVNDELDDFIFDANETLDSDGDGVADRYDDAPYDASRYEAVAEEGGGGGLAYAILALLVLCGLGALLIVKRNENPASVGSAFAEANHRDSMTETQFGEESKEVPQIEEPQQWEEGGVSWSKNPDGTLYYYDEATSSWLDYQQ